MLNTKDTNPKDEIGVKKWRQFCTIPFTVMWEIGAAMLEGARKYGRHNYRIAGVRGSIYIDAAMGHLTQWWEGEDIDPDSGMNHITKAITSLVVMRDAMINNKFTDDRPPTVNVDKIRADLQTKVEAIFCRYPDAVKPFLNSDFAKLEMSIADAAVKSVEIVRECTPEEYRAQYEAEPTGEPEVTQNDVTPVMDENPKCHVIRVPNMADVPIGVDFWWTRLAADAKDPSLARVRTEFFWEFKRSGLQYAMNTNTDGKLYDEDEGFYYWGTDEK